MEEEALDVDGVVVDVVVDLDEGAEVFVGFGFNEDFGEVEVVDILYGGEVDVVEGGDFGRNRFG